ncbi:MAG TPA: alpha/beta hydrolase [Burkholderiaceae bacterium]|nr:alpha/beta hydrolase [Burkholderiaceae bacterium]
MRRLEVRSLWTGWAAVLAACGLAACGGGGSGGPTEAAASAEAAYSEQVRADIASAEKRACPHVGPRDDRAEASGLAWTRCPEEARPHDERVFTVNEAALPFDALPGATVETDRWWGVLGKAGYRVEVPKQWNGMLVMYAHGYAGTGPTLGVSNPSIRRHLIEQGYAWAASSYSANYYDVRAGVEDTNALALAFRDIAKANGRPLPKPRKTYIIGHSMGGHIAGAAVELETLITARHKVRYDGAVPMCGVMGDTELFDYFVAYQLAAQQLAGFPATSFPDTGWATVAPQVRAALFSTFATVPTAQGLKLKAVVENLTGGDRPIFDQGFANTALQNVVWGTFGGDGTINGILTRNVTDTRGIVYQFDADPALSAEEAAFNASILRVRADPLANRLRWDGLRWIPKVNGFFRVPVVSIHTLGDMYVPFHMQQIYRERAERHGSDRWLVQRAIRAPSHCDFTIAEQVAAFEAMAQWEQRGVKPQGDDVLDRARVADPAYGCRFTQNAATTPEDNPVTIATRALMPACPAGG